jgi:hypothetical protein
MSLPLPVKWSLTQERDILGHATVGQTSWKEIFHELFCLW